MYEWDFYAGFYDVVRAILGGYISAVAVHILLTYLMTREGRGVLMAGDGMSRAYYLQLGLCWMVTGAVGVTLPLMVFPTMPMSVVSLVVVTVMLGLTLFRLRNKVPHQQTVADTVLLLLCMLVGTGVSSYIQLA